VVHLTGLDRSFPMYGTTPGQRRRQGYGQGRARPRDRVRRRPHMSVLAAAAAGRPATQLIASATLQRVRSRHLPQRRSQAGQSTQPAPAPHSDGPASIMVLNDRRRIYAPLNADASYMATLYKEYELADPATIVVAKVFHRANSEPQRFRTFLRKVRTMRLHDPHIGKIINVGQTADRRRSTSSRPSTGRAASTSTSGPTSASRWTGACRSWIRCWPGCRPPP
jgi:hypothetical protein